MSKMTDHDKPSLVYERILKALKNPQGKTLDQIAMQVGIPRGKLYPKVGYLRSIGVDIPPLGRAHIKDDVLEAARNLGFKINGKE